MTLPVLFRPPFPKNYAGQVLNTAPANLIAYWPMWEPSGAVSNDLSPEGNNGAYTAVTLGQLGIGDGRTSASFDNSTSFNNVYSVGLDGDWNGAEGSLGVWAKVSGAGVWTDSTLRSLVHIRADASNLVYIVKTTVDNQIQFAYAAGGTTKSVNFASGGSLAWNHFLITWSAAGDTVKAYVNGTQVGSTQTGLGVWVNPLNAVQCNIGARFATPTWVWDGTLAHAPLWDTPLTAPQIAPLGVV